MCTLLRVSYYEQRDGIGHFRVPKSLTLSTRPSANNKKIIFIRKFSQAKACGISEMAYTIACVQPRLYTS